MTPVSIHAVYDGEEVRLLEKAPVEGSYHVLVTFVEPVPDVQPSEQDLSGLWASFGAWRDERSIEATLQDIREARSSKTEAPAL